MKLPDKVYLHPDSALDIYSTKDGEGRVAYYRQDLFDSLKCDRDEAMVLILKLRRGVERYCSDLCREADEYIDRVEEDNYDKR